MTGWENIDVPTPLSIVAGVLNRPANAVELDQSFGDNGGTSMDLVQTILQLGQSNFKISLPEFLAAVTVRELIAQCDWTPPGSAVKSFSPIGTVSPRKQHDFTAVTFSTSSKEDVVNLLNAAFAGEANELSEGYPRLMTSDELRHIAEKFVDEAAADASGSSFCFGVEEKGMIEAVAIAFDIYGDFAQARRIFTGPPGPVTRLVESIMTPFLSAIPAKPGTPASLHRGEQSEMSPVLSVRHFCSKLEPVKRLKNLKFVCKPQFQKVNSHIGLSMQHLQRCRLGDHWVSLVSLLSFETNIITPDLTRN